MYSILERRNTRQTAKHTQLCTRYQKDEVPVRQRSTYSYVLDIRKTEYPSDSEAHTAMYSILERRNTRQLAKHTQPCTRYQKDGIPVSRCSTQLCTRYQKEGIRIRQRSTQSYTRYYKDGIPISRKERRKKTFCLKSTATPYG